MGVRVQGVGCSIISKSLIRKLEEQAVVIFSLPGYEFFVV
jgi:hypothetical protein